MKVYFQAQGTIIIVINDEIALSHSYYVMDMDYFNGNQ